MGAARQPAKRLGLEYVGLVSVLGRPQPEIYQPWRFQQQEVLTADTSLSGGLGQDRGGPSAFYWGPIGAVLGAAIGHNVDRGLTGRQGPSRRAPGRARRIRGFFTGPLHGPFCKADGRVCPKRSVRALVMSRQDL